MRKYGRQAYEALTKVDRIRALCFMCLICISLDESDYTKSFVNHVQTSLSRQAYNLGTLSMTYIQVFP